MDIKGKSDIAGYQPIANGAFQAIPTATMPSSSAQPTMSPLDEAKNTEPDLLSNTPKITPLPTFTPTPEQSSFGGNTNFEDHEPEQDKKSRLPLWAAIALLLLLLIGGGWLLNRQIDQAAREQEQLQNELQAQLENIEGQTEVNVNNLTDRNVSSDNNQVKEAIGSQPGPTGLAGNDGQTGSQGPPGSPGANGRQGVIGQAGLQGPQGAQGPSGTAACDYGDCLSLQATTPGMQEIGHINLSGTAKAGSFEGDGAGVTNVDAATLQGNNAAFYQNASNLNAGTLASARLTGSYSGITGTGALSSGSIAAGFGTIATANTIQGSQLISIVATGTAPLQVASTTKVTNLNADLLDGLDSTAFAAASGSGNYIQNQNTTDQTANFRISGNGQLGGQLLFGSGTPDTNLYRPSGQNNTLQTDGVLRLNYSAGANTLQLLSTTAGTGLTIGGDTNLYRSAANTLKTDDSLQVVGTITQGGNNVCDASNNCGYAASSNAFIQGGNSFGTTAILGTNDANALTFETNNAERLRVDTSGRVGIGTTAPAQKLHVSGGHLAVDNNGYAIGFRNAANNGWAGYFDSDASNNTNWHYNDSGSVAMTVLNSNGNVGIGTTTPSSALQLGSDAGTSASGIKFGSTGDTNLYRSAADTLKTDDFFRGGAGFYADTNTGNIAFRGTQAAGSAFLQNETTSGDTNPAYRVLGNGKTEWGVGGASALDTNLYRSAADVLTTDDSLIVEGNTSGYNTAAATLKVGKDSVTGRSINAAGTINAAGADFAEWIAWSGPKPAVGSVIQKHGQLYVVSSTATAAFVGNDKISGSDSILVGFSGQVPVRVSAEGGAIAAGDYLTLGTDGRAKKATGPAQVVGRAQGSLASGTGTIQVTLQYMYYNPTAGDFIQNGGGASLSSLAVSGSASLGGLNVSGPTTLSTLNVSGAAVFEGSVRVAGTVTTGNLVVNGKIAGNDNTRGEVSVATGRTSQTFTFPDGDLYDTPPNVVATPTGNPGAYYWVSDITTSGFTINLADPTPTEVTFNFQAQQ